MPANDAEYQRQYMRDYRRAGRDKSGAKHRVVNRDFVGCDGEGRNLANGYHAYFMLRIGEETIYPKMDAVRLTTYECLDFIASRDPKRIYVGYYFDYDVAKILEDLPFPKLQRLLNRSMRTGINGKLFPVDWQDFQIEYLPRKEFKVRRRLWTNGPETKWGPWVVINDVGSFFQCQFLKAIKSWKVGTEEEWRLIDDGKKKRADFAIEDLEEIARYNGLEIALLETVMDRFRSACIESGYVPARWQGPGVLAETMLRNHGVPLSRDTDVLTSDRTLPLVAFATNAFYGGRTEVSAIGPVRGPVYQYDINSAYPYAMRVVPCLIHGRWDHVKAVSPFDIPDFDRPSGSMGESFALCYGEFGARRSPSAGAVWFGLPLRTSTGTIVYPQEGRGWYWSFEIGASIHQRFQVEEMWVYTRDCLCRPLGFVEDVYRKRRALGKDGAGVVLKLALNSLYGKTVQSIGMPKYSNPIWGSFITAYPRMMIQDFIHSSPWCRDGTQGGKTCGRDVLMVATDSVASLTERLDYPDSEELGGWSMEEHPGGIFIVQPGVYFGTSKKAKEDGFKTRGVPRVIVEKYEAQFRDAFRRMVETSNLSDGEVRLPQKIFCGVRYAVHRRNLKLLGQWIEFGEGDRSGKVVSFDWTTKRAIHPALAPTTERTYIQTFPYKGKGTIETVPYSKNIGGLLEREEMRLPFQEQPDWTGIIPDD